MRRQCRPLAAGIVEPLEADRHAGSRAATRRVKHVACEEAGRIRLHECAQAHPRNLMHLRDGSTELLFRAVVYACSERCKDGGLVGVAHGQDEGEAKLGLVCAIELGEASHLLRRQASQSRTLLLFGRLDGELTSDGGFAGKVWMSAQQAELLLLSGTCACRSECFAHGGQRFKRPSCMSTLYDPFALLIHGAHGGDEGLA
mmetsp:Transcript_43321/g.113857  ORF Transcript_43321/g.113857 Transcript_43321/m.113857 type:complete len:201 (+) Transcript_43321:468-1070(+)